ncbi:MULTISPECIES: PD-(D/E)XK nuclease family protein [Streptomyces]|uniref:PD-(D/E)XK nuclease family protein n=1 Tax=Streptomyces TaxID=1883 RepID=UPI001F27D832|nr:MULTISPECIES: PD-(D/E)XK nuclease family protein [Streptomyces]
MSASDAESYAARCGVFLAAKVRRRFTVAGWERRHGDDPFMLKVTRQVIAALHRDERIATWEGLQEALREQMAQYPDLHPGVERYIAHAVEQYLDAHDELAAQYEEVRFFAFDPAVGSQGREVTVWAPLYSSVDGVREVRRLRVNKARSSAEEHDRWATVAAFAAAGAKMRIPPVKIRIVEAGLFDGSTEVVFEATPDEVRTRYETYGRPVIKKLLDAADYRPGQSCQDCKLAGCCPSLEDLSGCLGQRRPGTHTRSVSAADLELYLKCPARWYLETVCRLPPARMSSEASDRGRIIHRWLAQAHARGTRCTEQDVAPLGQAGAFTGTLTAEEYAKTREFLAAHARLCPLADGVEVVAVEPSVYGYDGTADVVIASQPDLVYRGASGQIFVRETKTTTQMPADESDAFDRFFPVPWLMNIASTAKDAFGETEMLPVVELEVITSEGARVFTWDLERDQDMVRMARAEVRQRASSWIRDATWSSSPGSQCTWCPVRRWCPDAADAHGDADGQPQVYDEPCAGLQAGLSD